MGTTEVQLSEDDRSLLEKLTVTPKKGSASGGYVSPGLPLVPEHSDRDLLRQILDVLKEIRDQVVIETSTPANPADTTFWDEYGKLPPWRRYSPPTYPLPYVGDWPPYYGTWTYSPSIEKDHVNV